jgi:hypothetical protein
MLAIVPQFSQDLRKFMYNRGTVLLPGSIFSNTKLKILSVMNESTLRRGCSFPVFLVKESYAPAKQGEVHAKILEPSQACKITIRHAQASF